MPGRAAARITDNVAHPLPPVLTGGPGSRNVLIGSLPAWRGVLAPAVAGLLSAKTSSNTTVLAAEAASKAAAGTPGAPAALAAEQNVKTIALTTMSSTIRSAAAAGADIHNCATPSPVPPHGPGVVIDGSKTVLINNLPACRMGDTIIEALGPLPNKITKGYPTVLIGG
ncbi:PAAR domain-containing protein [uncultured Nostoc sp.]|uniref:PAAR domain-containing protein n=1 Tax=uncultured Nostoc sp. TaxID=340711 RepID=UPI002625FA7F|nr:PAAR domain-containing protein [uncultured Nostoc sp.]